MTSEFIRRAGFTLGALLIYRLGCHIPLPGINFEMVEQFFRTQPVGSPPVGGLKALLQASESASHVAIFALGIAPFVSAAVLLQLGGIIFSRLKLLQSKGERGRQTLRRLTFGLTIVLAAFQAYGVGAALEQINGAVVDPGALFLISTVATMTGGAVFLAWLSEQMTAFGFGNGIALILLFGTMTALRDPIVTIADLNVRGLLSSNTLLSLIALIVLTTGVAVVCERARRHFPVNFSNRQIGNRVFEKMSSVLTIKLNPAGLIPAILASWLIGIATLVTYLIAGTDFADYLSPGKPVYLALSAILIFLCTFFYTAYVFDPEQAADHLQQQGGAIALIAPGEATIAYLDAAVSRIALVGAIYLTAICLLPDILRFYLHVPLYLGGLPFLVLICTALDFDHQIRGYLGFLPMSRRRT